MEFILSVFAAYNKHANVQSKWSWPEDIEDISTSLKSDGELTLSLKEEWINFAQFISENESISIDENTFTIVGNHGSRFRFDAIIEYYIANLEASSASWKIKTSYDDSLGFHDFPAHMTGLELKQYEGSSTCILPSGDSFIGSITLLIKLLIEDEDIWNILHKQEIARRKSKEEFDKKWPNGRPEDWMYL
jgi:hypothetical protein